jgi:hypothetical protein
MTTYVIGGALYSAAQVAVANQIYDFATSEMGWDSQQGDMAHIFAIAAVANADRETSFNAVIVGDQDTAKGLYQWHAPRRALIKLKTKVDVWDGTVASSLTGMRFEMTGTGGEYGPAFEKIIACAAVEDASEAWCRYYEEASASNAVARSRSLATAWSKFFQGNA